MMTTAYEPVGTSRRHTSEPRWQPERPDLDRSARHLVIVHGTDAVAVASATAWKAEAEQHGIAATLVGDDPPSIEAALAAATAATRLMAAGDECVLAAATSAAERAGWSRSEVRTQLTHPAGPRPVQCVHCRTITATTAQIDEQCSCGGCGVPLLIFAHYSRRIGAYLGFRADAEELPA